MPLVMMNMTVRTKPARMAPMEMMALRFFERSVKSVMNAAENSGRNKIHQANDMCSMLMPAKTSQFHRGQILDVRGLAFAIERHDEREADRYFRRRHGDDEKHQHLAVELVVEPGKENEGKVRRV